jgi:hypothetical protein
MRSQEERVRDLTVYVGNNLEDADVGLWNALTNLTELAKQNGESSGGYALALSRAVAGTRASVQELKRAVERELASMVDDDFPEKEAKE